MIVAHADASDAGEDVKELVAVSIGDIVSDRLLHVDWEVLLLVAGGLTVSLDACQSSGSREGCLHGRASWLIRETKSGGGEALISRHGAEGGVALASVLELGKKVLLHSIFTIRARDLFNPKILII